MDSKLLGAIICLITWCPNSITLITVTNEKIVMAYGKNINSNCEINIIGKVRFWKIESNQHMRASDGLGNIFFFVTEMRWIVFQHAFILYKLILKIIENFLDQKIAIAIQKMQLRFGDAICHCVHSGMKYVFFSSASLRDIHA